MKKKKFLTLALIIAMITCMGTYSISFADTKAEKEQQADEIKNQQSELSDSLENLQSQIDSQQKELDAVQAKVDAKEAEIATTQAMITETEEDIEKQKEGLDARLRTMYKNGSVGYLDIILSSSSVSELISNFEMVQKIYKSDQETLDTLKEQQAALKAAKEQLDADKAELDTQKSDLEKKQEAINATYKKMKAQYDEQEKELQQLASEISQLEAAANVSSGSGSGGSVIPPSYGGGQFQWPCNCTTITSWFGPRPYPGSGGSTNHGGIDIAGSGCNGTPIYACASGTVILASWYGGYGNCVMIAHGGGITTLYGHMSSIGVSNGQSVSKGQVIGKIGSTGNSTGPHLHLSVFVNGVAVDPLNYL